MKRRALVLVVVAAVTCMAASCNGPRGYEFLQTPRAGLKAGSMWKEGIGPITDGPPQGVAVAGEAQGPEWFQSKTGKKGVANVTGLLAGFFSANLGITSEEIVGIKAEGFVHQQVVNPEKMPRGYAYLWETIEASKIKLTVDRKLEGILEGKIDRFVNSEVGKKANLEFKVSGSSGSTYEVTGKDLVVAVRVVKFDIRTKSGTATLKLGKEAQDATQPGPFGYAISVERDGVDLPNRKVKVVLWNQQIADSSTGTWKCTLTSAGTTEIHTGPVVGEKCDRAVDTAYVSSWDLENLTCQVTFQRTMWELKQIGCGLETVK